MATPSGGEAASSIDPTDNSERIPPRGGGTSRFVAMREKSQGVCASARAVRALSESLRRDARLLRDLSARLRRRDGASEAPRGMS